MEWCSYIIHSTVADSLTIFHYEMSTIFFRVKVNKVKVFHIILSIELVPLLIFFNDKNQLAASNPASKDFLKLLFRVNRLRFSSLSIGNCFRGREHFMRHK
jgi:hypothetical protein